MDAYFVLVMTHILHKKNIDVSACTNINISACRIFFKNYSKCIKKLKTVAFGADLLKDENIDHAEKKSSK